MKPNRKTIQFMLLSLGVLLIFGTYIFYPKFNKTIDGENLVENNKETTIDNYPFRSNFIFYVVVINFQCEYCQQFEARLY